MDSAGFPDEETPLVPDNSPIQSRRNHTRDVHILSCAFLLIFLAYGAAQNLETSVNTVSFKFRNLICGCGLSQLSRPHRSLNPLLVDLSDLEYPLMSKQKSLKLLLYKCFPFDRLL